MTGLASARPDPESPDLETLVVERDIANAVSSDYRDIRPESGTGFVSGQEEKADSPAPSHTRTSSKPLGRRGADEVVGEGGIPF